MRSKAFVLLLALALTTIFSSNVFNIKVDCSSFKNLPAGKESICYALYDPICGSDGRTYSNDCRFCYEVVKSNYKLKFAHFGACCTYLEILKYLLRYPFTRDT
ncbi:serine protease inhibitor Kazal-type 9-like [Trichechus inunguis]